jgi:dihydrofolate reductase
VVHSLDEALALVDKQKQVFIIGGGEIYKQAMPYCNVLEITRVHETYEADTFFPPIDPEDWQLLKEEHHPSDEKHAVPFSYLTFKRR